MTIDDAIRLVQVCRHYSGLISLTLHLVHITVPIIILIKLLHRRYMKEQGKEDLEQNS